MILQKATIRMFIKSSTISLLLLYLFINLPFSLFEILTGKTTPNVNTLNQEKTSLRKKITEKINNSSLSIFLLVSSFILREFRGSWV